MLLIGCCWGEGGFVGGGGVDGADGGGGDEGAAAGLGGAVANIRKLCTGITLLKFFWESELNAPQLIRKYLQTENDSANNILLKLFPFVNAKLIASYRYTDHHIY